MSDSDWIDSLCDLISRMDDAELKLVGLAAEHKPRSTEAIRLESKANGVRLASGYVSEELRRVRSGVGPVSDQRLGGARTPGPKGRRELHPNHAHTEKAEEGKVSLIVSLDINDKAIGMVEITRYGEDVSTDPDSVNRYRWRHYVEGVGLVFGQVKHRYGDGATALAHKVLGEILRTMGADQ